MKYVIYLRRKSLDGKTWVKGLRETSETLKVGNIDKLTGCEITHIEMKCPKYMEAKNVR